jgi:hypothetical protein
VQLLVTVSVEVDEDDEYERDQSIIRMLCDIAPGFILSQVKRPTCRAGYHAVRDAMPCGIPCRAGCHAVRDTMPCGMPCRGGIPCRAGCHLCGATLRVFF